MADDRNNGELEGLLIALARSMLQYVGESWPWTGDDEEERQTLDKLVARQQGNVARLADLLMERRRPIDFGSYPTEFTDLHYLALDHLLGRLIEDQRSLIETIEGTQRRCAGDEEAALVVGDILASEREILHELEGLAARHRAGSAA